MNVFLINDTRCCDTTGLELRNWEIERADHPSNSRRPGGSAIVIKNNLNYKRIKTDAKESVCIEVESNIGLLRIATTYCHPGELVDEEIIKSLITDSDEVVGHFIAGDMNAHIGLEAHRDPDFAGLHLVNLMDKYDLHLLNSNDYTYNSCSCSTMSCLDLAYAKLKSNSGLQAEWKVLDPGSSDHLPTMIDLHSSNTPSHINKKNYIKITDWDAFKNGLDHDVTIPNHPLASCDEIENLVVEIEDMVKSNLELSTRKVKILRRNDIILSKSSRKLIELRRNLLKLRKQDAAKGNQLLRKLLNKLSYDIKNSIKKDTDLHENRRAVAVMNEKDSSKKWKLFKCYANNGNNVNKIGDIVDIGGLRKSDDQDKANAFAEKLKISHSYPSSPDFDRICEADVTASYNVLDHFLSPKMEDLGEGSQLHLGFPSDNEPFDEITPEEVTENLMKTNSKSAGGPDGITYRHLKEGGARLVVLLSYLFNMILITGYYPLRWGKVNVSMLHKSGKSKLPVANYRPISLSNCLSKLFECSIKTRFEQKLSRIRPENPRQSAYKKNRGTQENCLKLTEAVVDAFNVRECVIGTFLDVSGAFDKVWKEGLIIKLARWGLGRRLTRIIRNFLSSRSLVVKIGNYVSDAVYLLAGTPQGSVLSPTLFNSFMDDLWELIPPEVELLQYADDICLYISGSDPEICAMKLQEALDAVAKWASVWRVTMAPEKSSWILFSRCPTHKRANLSFSLNSKTIEKSDKITFLGVIFDENLTWKSYLEQQIRSATAKAIQLQTLSAKSRFGSPDVAINFFNAMIKPIFDYGAVVYCAINQSQWDKIDKFHGRFLRSICGLPKCCSYEKLRKQLHQEKLSVQIKDQAADRMAGICSNSPYAYSWLTDKGYVRLNKSFVKLTHSTYPIYKSPVEVALDRHIMLSESKHDVNP